MPSDDDLKTGLDCLKTLYGAYTSLPSDGSSILKPQTWLHAVSPLRTESKALTNAVTSVAADVDDWFVDGQEWIKQRAKDATDWFVNTAGKLTCLLHPAR